MIRKLTLMATLALIALTLFSIELYARGEKAPGISQASAKEQAEDVPAYHSKAPKGPLPKTQDPDMFDDPLVKNAYAMAGKIESVLYQQPCYCHCDQAENHTCLLDCFVGDHGAHCDLCQQEAIYSYNESKKGKTAAQIRKGIMEGKYKEIDLDKYRSPMKLD